MPRPRYIICSEKRLLDRSTNLATHINVLDRIQLNTVHAPAEEGTKVVIPVIPLGEFVCTATWMREDTDDPKAAYEIEMRMHVPGGEVEMLAQTEIEQFERRFHRLDVAIVITTETKIKQDGILLLESRLRQKGTDSWISQTFPLEVEVKHHTAVQSEQIANEDGAER